MRVFELRNIVTNWFLLFADFLTISCMPSRYYWYFFVLSSVVKVSANSKRTHRLTLSHENIAAFILVIDEKEQFLVANSLLRCGSQHIFEHLNKCFGHLC